MFLEKSLLTILLRGTCSPVHMMKDVLKIDFASVTSLLVDNLYYPTKYLLTTDFNLDIMFLRVRKESSKIEMLTTPILFLLQSQDFPLSIEL